MTVPEHASPAVAVARAGARAVRRPWRWAVVRRAADVTASLPARRLLVLAPHPDDETFGCGATIARAAAAGTEVTVMVAADGRSSHRSAEVTADELAAMRASEVQAAVRELGLPEDRLVLLRHPDDSLAGRHAVLVSQIVDVVDRHGPDVVLVSSAHDWHPDHRALASAAAAAVARRPHLELLAYPVWYWAEGPWLRRPGASRRAKAAAAVGDLVAGLLRPAVVVRTQPFLERKRAAIACYRSQTQNLTGEPDWAVLDDAFLSRFLGPVEVFFPTPA